MRTYSETDTLGVCCRSQRASMNAIEPVMSDRVFDFEPISSDLDALAFLNGLGRTAEQNDHAIPSYTATFKDEQASAHLPWCQTNFACPNNEPAAASTCQLQAQSVQYMTAPSSQPLLPFD